jgi:hypothetical protein
LNNIFYETIVTEDEILLDEEMDDEFIETEDIGVEEEGEDSMNSGKLSERCRYWPACKNGDQCEFQHPTTPCKSVQSVHQLFYLTEVSFFQTNSFFIDIQSFSQLSFW